jgi:WD40 repeat protein
VRYTVYRITGRTITPASELVRVGETEGTITTLIDPEELPNGVPFIYFVKATFTEDTVSGPSNFVTIMALDDPPVGNADAFTTTEDAAVAGNVLRNDTDIDTIAERLRAVLVSAPSFGTVVLNPDGSFVYTPMADYYGTDTFTYVANDGIWSRDDRIALSPNSNVTPVVITITEVNDPPRPVEDDKRTPKETTLRFPAADLLANDAAGPANESNQALVVTAVTATPETHGQVSLSEGIVTYVPDQLFGGTAAFEYKVEDRGTTNGVADYKSAIGRVLVAVSGNALVVNGSSNKLHVLNLSDYTITSTLDLDGVVTSALDVATTSDGRHAVVTSADGTGVLLDLTAPTPSIVRTFATPTSSDEVRVTVAPTGQAILTAATPDDTVVSMDVGSGQMASPLRVPFDAQGLAAAPDRGVLLAHSFQASSPGEPQGQIHVLRLAEDGTLSDGAVSVSTGGTGAVNATVSPDGRLALVPNLYSGNIGVLRIDADGQVSFVGTVASSLAFEGAQAIAFSPDGSRAYVKQAAGTVAVLNIDRHDVSDSGVRIDTGVGSNSYPGIDDIASDATGAVLVHLPAATANGHGFVVIIDPRSHSVIATVPIPNDHAGGGIAAIP